MNTNDLLDLSQTLAQMRFNFTNIREHLVGLNCFQGRRHRGHRDHAASERRSQIVFFDMRSDLFPYQTSADGNAAAERLRQSDDVRYDSVTRVAPGKEPIARAADSGLHFVIDQDDAAHVAQFAPRAIE